MEELKGKQNWRETVSQGGKLAKEGVTLPTSLLLFTCFLFPPIIPQIPFLLNSFLWKAVLFSLLLPNSPETIPLRPCTPWLGGHRGKAPDLLTVTDGCAEAHNGRHRHVISLAAGLWKKEPKPKSDLREADLIKVTAKGRAAGVLNSLSSTRDKALKYSSRRKIQGSYVGRMLKGVCVWAGWGVAEMCLINRHKCSKSSSSSDIQTSKCSDNRKRIMSVFWHAFQTKKYSRWIMRCADWRNPELHNPGSKQSVY